MLNLIDRIHNVYAISKQEAKRNFLCVATLTIKYHYQSSWNYVPESTILSNVYVLEKYYKSSRPIMAYGVMELG